MNPFAIESGDLIFECDLTLGEGQLFQFSVGLDEDGCGGSLECDTAFDPEDGFS